MAEKEQTEESEPKKKKSSNLLMIIIIVVLVLIIIIGAVVTVLLMNGDDTPTATNTTQVKEKKIKHTNTSSSGDDLNNRNLSEIGVLYPLDTFTVNLKSDAGRRYLKTTISLELSDAELSHELDAKSAVLRDVIIRILSSKTLEEVSSKKGKQKLSEQIMDRLNSMITDGQIKGIYFTEFVIQ